MCDKGFCAIPKRSYRESSFSERHFQKVICCFRFYHETGNYYRVTLFAEPTTPLLVLSKLVWWFVVFVWLLVVPLALVFSLVVLVCPPVVSVCPLVLPVCPLVVLVYLSVVLSLTLLLFDFPPAYFFDNTLLIKWLEAAIHSWARRFVVLYSCKVDLLTIKYPWWR